MKPLNQIRSVLTIVSLLAVAPCFAQQQDPIDQAYQTCLQKDTSTANICACAFTAYGKWETEMNNAYKKLSKTLKTDKDKAALKQAQAAWLAYKEAEFTNYDHIFNRPGGKWCGIRQDNRIEMIRARTLQLRAYTEALKKKN